MDRKVEIAIQLVIEEAYFALDTAAPTGISSKEWIGMVAEVVNGMDTYEDWVKEVWL